MSEQRPVLPPPGQESGSRHSSAGQRRGDSRKGSLLGGVANLSSSNSAGSSKGSAPARPAASGPRTRTAHLRLTRIDPLSVMKMTFLLSIALGVVLVVAVTIAWTVLSAVGVWDNINSSVQQVIGSESGENFDVSKYIGTPRVIGFSLIASVINVVLLTAIATLSAFIYNLAAALLGGVEMSWSEDR